MNIGWLAVDRHAAGDRANHPAIRYISQDGTARDLSFLELAASTSRFADVLRRLGVDRGDRVFSLLGRVPDLHISALGTLKHAAVFCPLVPQLGPDPIALRLARGDARVLVTTTALYDRKVVFSRDALPTLQHVLLVDGREHPGKGVWSLPALLAEANDRAPARETTAETPALLHFPSGTTGAPTGGLHVHEAALLHYATGRFVLDLQPEDIYWCTAEPGWATATTYGIIAPLLHGVTTVVDAREFDPDRWFRVLGEQQVTVWFTSPTAVRRLMRALVPSHVAERLALRSALCVGEPVDAETLAWSQRTLGVPLREVWSQTETGGIIIANHAGLPIRPGSMGRSVPGIEVALVRRTDHGVVLVEEPGVDGEIAIRTAWPSMFRGYVHDDARYAKCFAGGWYLSGDLATRDADGYYWFLGRTDDAYT